MEPRIYTYKITFEEVPHWYWGIHKERKYGESYLGTPVTHKWMWDHYTPMIQILEFFDNWTTAKEVEDRLILPDLNNPLCLNQAVGFYKSIEACVRGGKRAQEILKEREIGFYGPKTALQIATSRQQGSLAGHKYGKENGTKVGKENVKLGRGIWGMTKEDLRGSRGEGGKVGGKTTGAQKWMDPDHPELGEKPACVLVSMQKRRGYPHGKENRIQIDP